MGWPVRVAYDPADARRAHDLSTDASGFGFAKGTAVFAAVLGSLWLVSIPFVVRLVVRQKPRHSSASEAGAGW